MRTDSSNHERIFKIKGDSIWLWWKRLLISHKGVFILQLLFVIPLIILAGSGGCGTATLIFAIAFPIAYVWWQEFKVLARIPTSVIATESELKFWSPLFQKTVSWFEIKDLMTYTDPGARPLAVPGSVLLLKDGQEIVLSSALSGSNELYQLIESQLPLAPRKFDAKERIDQRYFGGANTAAIGFMAMSLLGFSWGLLPNIDSAPERYLIAAVGLAIYIGAFLLWRYVQGKIGKTILADKDGLVIQTVASKYEIPANQIAKVRQFGPHLIVRTNEDWLLIPAVNRLKCKSQLLSILRDWKFDLGSRFHQSAEVEEKNILVSLLAMLMVMYFGRLVIGVIRAQGHHVSTKLSEHKQAVPKKH